MRKAIVYLLLLICAGAAGAEPLHDKVVDEANAPLLQGDPQAAIDRYRELQVEFPDRPELHYNLGVAHYEKANAMGPDQAEAAQAELEEAKGYFERAAAVAHGKLSRDAHFNAANTEVAAARLLKQGDPKRAVSAYQEAIRSYEDLLQRNPDDDRVHMNRAVVRRELKEMLRNPPPPEDQQQDGEQEQEKEEGEQDPQEQEPQESKEQEGDKQQQEQQDSQDPQEDKQDQQEEPQEKSGDEQEEKQEEQDQEDQQKQGDQQQQQPGDQENDDKKETQPAGEPNEEPELPQQELEALLDSLEEMDNREQYEMRDVAVRFRVPVEWW